MFWKKSKDSDERLEAGKARPEKKTDKGSDDSHKDRKETALDTFQERGYDSGFVYHEE